MTKDIGIVFLPNSECKNVAFEMTEAAARALPGFKKAQNNPHITAIHIANLNEDAQENLKQIADKFFLQYKSTCIEFPVTGIKATGGNLDEGFKWLDLQFETLESLKNIRQAIVNTFCSLHNGTLTRMYDDIDKFTETQNEQIEKCGVTFNPYLPHITAWYIDLPNELKTRMLHDVAENFVTDIETCSAENIALVDLGRNGNAIEIIATYPLCVGAEL